MIEIKTEKIWQGECKVRSIESIKAVKNTNLPDEYLKIGKGPCCYITTCKDRDFLVWEEYANYKKFFKRLCKNDIVHEEDFQDILSLVIKSGKRLRNINNKLRQEKKIKEWSGKQTFRI